METAWAAWLKGESVFRFLKTLLVNATRYPLRTTLAETRLRSTCKACPTSTLETSPALRSVLDRWVPLWTAPGIRISLDSTSTTARSPSGSLLAIPLSESLRLLCLFPFWSLFLLVRQELSLNLPKKTGTRRLLVLATHPRPQMARIIHPIQTLGQFPQTRSAMPQPRRTLLLALRDGSRRATSVPLELQVMGINEVVFGFTWLFSILPFFHVLF